MTIKNILVPFNTAEASKAALSIALKMAHKYHAHVTGLFCVDPVRPLRNGLGTYEMIVKAVQEGHEKLKAEATELFNSQVPARLPRSRTASTGSRRGATRIGRSRVSRAIRM